MLHKFFNKKRFQNFHFVLTFLSFCLLIDQNCSALKNSRIQIRENGYENILIGIDEKVDEDIRLLDNLKKAFTFASNFLFSISRKRVFFKEIIILIPNSWNTEVYYDDSLIKSSDSRIKNSTWESIENADILIENWDYSTNEIPFVVNYASKCGQTGDSIIFPSKFFSYPDRSNKLFGSMTNLIVDLWSQFRYGIYSEYPAENEETNNEFYLNQNGEIEPTRCNAAIQGTIKNKYTNKDCEKFLANGLPSSECIFEEETNLNYLKLIPPSLIEMTEFCDNQTDHIHNRLAPTIQNTLCNGQSIWEVLRSHPDFRDFNKMPVSHTISTEPKFHVIKSQVKNTVILIDKSIHYLQDFNKLKNALSDFTRLMIDDEMIIGVVHFERTAKVVSKMMKVKDLKKKSDFVELIIPKKGSGLNSNIWNGLSLSLSLLDSNKNNQILPSGGRIVIITNSLSDPFHPNIEKIIYEAKKNEIIIDLIMYGSKNDGLLENLVKLTKGVSFKINSKLTDIWSSLNSISNRDRNVQKNIELFNVVYEIGKQKKHHHFYIDSSISQKNAFMKIIFSFRGIKEKVDLSIFDPRGVIYDTGLTLKCNKTNDIDDQEELICEFFKPKEGKWSIRINSPWGDNYELKIVAMVYFGVNQPFQEKKIGYYNFEDKYKRNTNTELQLNQVKVEAKWAESVLDADFSQSIYLALSVENKPIINAKVEAVIYRPTGDYVRIDLYDNGLNSDRFKDDGIYSRYFSEFNSNGIYYGKIEILTVEDSKICHHKTLGPNIFVSNPNFDYSKSNDGKELCSSVQNVHRVIHLDSFEMKNYKSGVDVIPPSKIRDLKVVDIDYRNEFVQLGFTAPGNDYDVGRCFKYEIRISNDASIFLTNGNLTNDEFLPIQILASSFRDIPNLSGHFEDFHLSFKNIEAKVIFVQIRALDENQNYGEWSNFVNIKLTNEITFSYQIKSLPKSLIETKNIDYLKDIKEKQNLYSSIFIFIFAFLLLIFMVQIIFVVLLVLQKFNKKKCFHDYVPIRV